VAPDEYKSGNVIYPYEKAKNWSGLQPGGGRGLLPPVWFHSVL